MGYAVVVAAALAVGVAVYALTLRRSTPPDTDPFAYQGSAARRDAAHPSEVTSVPVDTGTPVSWQSRSISLLGLVAFVMVFATTIAVAIYQVGSVLVRAIIRKLQGG